MEEENGTIPNFLEPEDIMMIEDDFTFDDIDIDSYLCDQPTQGYTSLLTSGYNQPTFYQQQQQPVLYQMPQGVAFPHLQPEQVNVSRSRDHTTMSTSPYDHS